MTLPPRTTSTRDIPVERDAEGFPLCRQCKTSIRTGKRPKQRTFCGDPNCLHLWKLKSDPNYQALHVLDRDHGVCSSCGLDCVALLLELRELLEQEKRRAYGPGLSYRRSLHLDGSDLPVFKARCDELGLPRSFRSTYRRLWEMDHTLPVVEGGGSCGLENLRTLCWACHRKETTALAKRRAAARKSQ